MRGSAVLCRVGCEWIHGVFGMEHRGRRCTGRRLAADDLGSRSGPSTVLTVVWPRTIRVDGHSVATFLYQRLFQ